MLVSFFFSVVQLTAAGCFPDQPLPEAAIQEFAVPQTGDVHQSAPAGRFSALRQPTVPVKAITQAADRNIESLQCIPNTTQDQSDSVLPHVNVAMVSFSNTRSNADEISETCLFRYLDYIVMTPEYAFSPEANSPLVKLRDSSGLPPSDRGNSTEFTRIADAAAGSAEVRKDQEPRSPVSGPDASLNDIVNRPMSAIQLGAALSRVTSSGEALQTPAGVAEQRGTRIAEIHHIAVGSEPAHPSRNTFSFRHQPLYFEDPNMERCGDSHGCLTELTSIAHFAARIPLLPYLMASNSPHDCVRALPDCPTCSQFQPEAYIPRPTVKAVAAQAAATTGFFFLIP